MKKVFKVLGIIFLILIIFVVAAPFLFKGKIVEKIKTESNNNLQNVKLDFGDIDLSLIKTFPNFGLEINKVSLIGTNDFEGDTLIFADKLLASINVMSVIKGEAYEVNAIKLDKALINIKVLENGKANYDIVKPSADSAKAETEEPSSFKMALKKLDINDLSFIYDDATMPMLMALKHINLTGKGDLTADFTTLETKGNIQDIIFKYANVPYLNHAKADLKANIDMDLKNFKFTFKDNEIKLNDLVLALSGYLAMPKEDIDMDLKLAAQKAEFKHFLSMIPAIYAKDFDKLKAEGKLALDAYIKGIYNDTSMPAFGANLLIENGNFKYPSLPKAVNDVQLDVKVDKPAGDMDLMVVDIKKLHLSMADNPFDAKMLIKTPSSDLYLDGFVKGIINLDNVKEFIPLEEGAKIAGIINADVSLKGHVGSLEKGQYDRFAASGNVLLDKFNYADKTMKDDISINNAKLIFTPRFLELASFDSKIGKSDIKATGKLENHFGYLLHDKDLIGNLKVSSNFMDLNQFASEETNTKNAAADTAKLTVIEVPKNIDFNLSASFAKLLYDNLTIENVSGTVKIKDQTITLSNLKMNTLDGNLLVNGSYNTTDIAAPKVDMDMDIKNFNIAKTYQAFGTVKKLAPMAENILGTFSTKLSFKGILNQDMSPVLTSLDGLGQFNANNISIVNDKIFSKIGDALKLDQFKKMVIDKINLGFKIQEGKVIVNPFDLNFGQIKSVISGSNGLDQTINYVMTMKIPRSMFGGQANAVLNNMVAEVNKKGVNYTPSDFVDLDILVSGMFSNPSVKTSIKNTTNNVVNTVTNQLKDEANKKAEELKQQAQQKIEEERQKAEQKLQEEAQKAKQDAVNKAKEEGKKELNKIFKRP